MADRLKPAIAVVGGGWAGLAAAVELTDAGYPVTLHEAAKQLGGRARSVDWHGIAIDNGQHLLAGAYTATLALMARLATASRLERRPLELLGPDLRLRLPALPRPLHLGAGLLTARGLSAADKLAAARFMTALTWRGFRLGQDITAQALLCRYQQPGRLVRRLWQPLCVAALNTPLERASAQVFCNVLRDSLAGPRAASDLLFTRGALGTALPEAACAGIRAGGGEVRLASKVQRIARAGRRFHLAGPDTEVDRVVVATHPGRVADLVGGLGIDAGHFSWQPILTLWLRFADAVAMPYPMIALGDGDAPWAFERADLAPGLVAIVASAEGEHLAMAPDQLCRQWLAWLDRHLGPLPGLLDWTLITEKRATFACTPGLVRPDNRTRVPGLYLAGDYTAGDYPATLEGAVRSGVKCAQLIIAEE